uniref:Gustatory receptor n=1 Tax=Lutzomyia longipalpis TaxID=7200 RepID=A0A3F2ZDA2_LUTLO
MSFVHRLGWLFEFQKIISIPNFSENGNIRPISIALRIIILILSFSFTCIDIVNIGINGNIHPFRISKMNSSALFTFLTSASFFSNRLGFIFLIIYSLISNRSHLKFIKSALQFENRTGNYIKPSLKNRKIKIIRNLLVFLTIVFYVIISILSYPFHSIDFDTKSILSHIFFGIVLIIDILTIYYCSCIFKEFLNFTELLVKYFNVSSHSNYLDILMDLFRIIPLLNSALGGTVFVIISKQILMGCLSVYYNIWLFTSHPLTASETYILVCSAMWRSHYMISVALLYISGNKLTEKIEELLRKQNNLSCWMEERNLEKYHKFNKEQFQLWRFHSETRLLATGSTEINNSGIFPIFSFIVTCLVIMIQFKQMEDST